MAAGGGLAVCGQVVNLPDFSARDDSAVRRAISQSNVVINLIGSERETPRFRFQEVHVDIARRIAQVRPHLQSAPYTALRASCFPHRHLWRSLSVMRRRCASDVQFMPAGAAGGATARAGVLLASDDRQLGEGRSLCGGARPEAGDVWRSAGGRRLWRLRAPHPHQLPGCLCRCTLPPPANQGAQPPPPPPLPPPGCCHACLADAIQSLGTL